jgi:uncharacterized membrane protein
VPAPADRRLERLIGAILRIGVSAAAAVIVAGGIAYLARHGTDVADDRTFHGEPSQLRGIPAILRDAASFSSRGVIQLGLVLLVATPIARVAFSIIAFAARRDQKFVLVTMVVLGVLVLALLGSPP